MLRVFLNNNDYTISIDGTATISERVYWSVDLYTFINELSGELIATAGAYEYLRGQYDDSICGTVAARIEDYSPDGVLRDTASGVVYLNDIKWNLSRRAATFQIVLDPFIQLIDNNKSIDITLGVGTSKNQVDISSYSNRINVTLTRLTPTDADATGRRGWRIKDALAYMIAFMSDGTIAFTSDFFNSTDPYAYSVLMVGREVLYGNTPPSGVDRIDPTISFQALWRDIQRLCNLGMAVEMVDSTPTIRVEPRSYWQQSGAVQTFANIEELISETDRSMFYSTVRMGSKDFIKEPVYLGPINFYGFKQEQFFLEGQCNIDNELRLDTEKIIIDTNAICSSMPIASGGTDSDEYDEDIMLIQMTDVYMATTTSQPFLPTAYYYNDAFRNVNTAQRWAGWLPFALVQVVQSLQPLVRASHVGTQTVSTNTPWQTFAPTDDTNPPNFDVGGDYQVGLIDYATAITPTIPVQYYCGYFTAPADDYYQFSIFSQMNNKAYNETMIYHGRWNGSFFVEQSIPVLIHSATQPPWGPPPGWGPLDGIYINYVGDIQGTAGFYMEAGDVVFVYFNYAAGAPFPIFYSGVFETIQYGGVYAPQETDASMAERLTWEMPMTSQAWSTFKAAPFGLIQPTYIDGSFNSRTVDVSRNKTTLQTKFTTAMRRIDNR